MSKVTNIFEFKNRKLTERITKQSKSLKRDESNQATPHVPDGTACTLCNKTSNKMYSRMVFANDEINFCSRNCAVSYNAFKK